MKKQVSILIACVACAALAGHVLAAEKNDGSTLTKIGDPVPKFELTTLDGKVLKSDKLKGKVVFINFFATWCGPCRSELPHLEKDVWRRFGQNKNFAMVIVGREHSRKELLDFKNKAKYTMPFSPDPDRKVYGRFATRWIPRNYLVNPDGKIAFQSVGYDTEEFNTLLKMIQEGLAALEKPPAK